MRSPRIAALLLLSFVYCRHTNPAIPINRYGLPVVSSLELYEEIVRADPARRLVDLRQHVPSVQLEIRYATADNFMKKPLYPVARAFLRLPAADALAEAQRRLATHGLGIKVFDAYRPYRVTEMMWEPIRNPDYVADPAKGSRHNRGCAVDLTLVSLTTGEEIPMPTAYDDFTPRAGHAFADLPADVLANRALLRATMESVGFDALESEWWHYDFRGWREFELLDVPLEKLPPRAR